MLWLLDRGHLPSGLDTLYSRPTTWPYGYPETRNALLENECWALSYEIFFLLLNSCITGTSVTSVSQLVLRPLDAVFRVIYLILWYETVIVLNVTSAVAVAIFLVFLGTTQKPTVKDWFLPNAVSDALEFLGILRVTVKEGSASVANYALSFIYSLQFSVLWSRWWVSRAQKSFVHLTEIALLIDLLIILIKSKIKSWLSTATFGII